MIKNVLNKKGISTAAPMTMFALGMLLYMMATVIFKEIWINPDYAVYFLPLGMIIGWFIGMKIENQKNDVFFSKLDATMVNENSRKLKKL